MRLMAASAIFLLSSLSYAAPSDKDQFVERFNNIFDGVTPVCDSNKAPSAEKSGYHIAEVSKIDGSTQVLRVPQNTISKFKIVDGLPTADFYSYRWDKVSQTSKTERSFLKLETTDGLTRMNMYDKNGNLEGSHAIGQFPDGSVEFVMAGTNPYQKQTGLENANKDAEFYFYVIKAGKLDGEINYSVDDLYYVFPKDVREQAEKFYGKKFFSNKLDQNSSSYIGNQFTVEEVKEMAAKFGIQATEKGAKPWKNCGLPTQEEVADYQARVTHFKLSPKNKFAGTDFLETVRKPSSVSKKKKK